MRKVKVTIPAACTNLGPGLDSLGLALGLHNTIEMQLSASTPSAPGAEQAVQQSMFIEVSGENAYTDTIDHPVLQGAAALYKHIEQPMPGVEVRCLGGIPPDCGLADRAAWLIGGLFAANNLLDAPLRRDKIAELACRVVDRPIEALTALFGGLLLCAQGSASGSATGDPMVYRRVELTAALRVCVIVPQPSHAARKKAASSEKLTARELAAPIGRALLLAEALRKGDLTLIGQVAHDDPLTAKHRDKLPGLDAVHEAAQRAGAQAVTFSGSGPALIAFAKTGHEAINAAALDALRGAGLSARAWVVNVDTQGVAINAQK